MLYGRSITTPAKVMAQPLIRHPDAGQWYKPVRHNTLIDTLEEVGVLFGLESKAQRYTMSADGYTLTGALRFSRSTKTYGAVEPRPWLAFTTSNARKGRLRFYLCGTIGNIPPHNPFGFAVEELLTGDKKRNHTLKTELEDVCKRYMHAYTLRMETLAQYVSSMKDIPCRGAAYERLLINTARNGPRHSALPWSLLGKLDGAILHVKERTLFDYMRAYGEAVKGVNTPRQLACHLVMSKLLQDAGAEVPRWAEV